MMHLSEDAAARCHLSFMRHPEGPRFHKRAEGSPVPRTLRFNPQFGCAEILRSAGKTAPLRMTPQGVEVA